MYRQRDEVDSDSAGGGRSGSGELRRVGGGEMKRKIIRFHKNKRKE